MREFSQLLWNIHQKRIRCDWSNADAEDELAKAFALNCVAQQIKFDFPLCYFQPLLTHQEWLDLVSLGAAHIPAKAGMARVTSRKKRGRLKLGYLSVDFRCHSGGFPGWNLVGMHDRGKFETIGLSIAPSANQRALRAIVADNFEHFFEFSDSDSDHHVANSIKKLNLDILVDTTRHVSGSRSGIIAERPARKIVSAWGYGGTTGSPSVDYLLADEVIVSNAEESYYSEKVIKLPFYHPVVPIPSLQVAIGRFQENLPPDAFVFGNFNAHYKLNPSLFRLWMDLVKSVPGSVFWLGERTKAGQNYLQSEAEVAGVSRNRLVFAKRIEQNSHIARLSLADLILDNPRLGGGSSVSDALQAGIPVVSWMGSTITDRSGASLLIGAGLQELVSDSPVAYVELARSLALNDSGVLLRKTRSQISLKLERSGLLDTQSFVRKLEQLYFDVMEER